MLQTGHKKVIINWHKPFGAFLRLRAFKKNSKLWKNCTYDLLRRRNEMCNFNVNLELYWPLVLYYWWLLKEPFLEILNWIHCLLFFSDFFGRRTAWMLGRTPPCAIVTPASNLFSSSSFLTASCKCLGIILVFLLSRAALPASSSISADKYSRTAAIYTGAPEPMRCA